MVGVVVKRSSAPRVRADSVAWQYSRASLAKGRTPWRDANFCVVDLELSGLDPRSDEIVSFAVVPIDAGRIIAGKSMYGLIRPTRDLSEESVRIHGLRMRDLAEAPLLDEAIGPLISALTGRIIVAHVAWVEKSFLGKALKYRGLRLRGPMIDTRELGQALAMKRRTQPSPFELGELAQSLSLPVHQPHNALGDALTTAQVFLSLATYLDGYSPQTVGSLARRSWAAHSASGRLARVVR
ncbi:MAG: PolC-type DNA polymerase III [Acidimicrobiales bacterium]